MNNRLPFVARLILRLTLPRGDREFLAGDLQEDYIEPRSRGRLAGLRWLARQILGAVGASVALRTRHMRRRPDRRTHRKGDPALDMLFRNIRFSLRTLRKQPGYTALVVSTLALGIGANTAIFSVVNAVLLRPLPFPEPDRMVVVSETVALNPLSQVSTAYVTYKDYRDESTTIGKMGAISFGTVVLTGDDEALRLQARFTSPSYLELMGAGAAIGRVFDSQDDEAPGAQDLHQGALVGTGEDGLLQGAIGDDVLDDRQATAVASAVTGIARRSLTAGDAAPAQEALGEHRRDGGGEEVRLDSHVEQAAEDLGTAPRVHRRDDQVPGQAGLDRARGRALVAHLFEADWAR